MTRIRRLRKGRCTVLLVIVMLIIMLLCGGTPKATAADNGRLMQSVVVSQGDTLWGLVREHYEYKADIRQAIYEVKQLNNLEDATIWPGQVLLIPQY